MRRARNLLLLARLISRSLIDPSWPRWVSYHEMRPATLIRIPLRPRASATYLATKLATAIFSLVGRNEPHSSVLGRQASTEGVHQLFFDTRRDGSGELASCRRAYQERGAEHHCKVSSLAPPTLGSPLIRFPDATDQRLSASACT